MLAYSDTLGARDARGEFIRFYVPRLQMPQINDLTKLAWALLEKYGNARLQEVKTASVQRHQHVVMDKRREATMPEDALRLPIVVSSDGFVIDGNHRHQAHLDKGLEHITALFVPMPFHDALLWLQQQPFVEYHAPMAGRKE